MEYNLNASLSPHLLQLVAAVVVDFVVSFFNQPKTSQFLKNDFLCSILQVMAVQLSRK
jgi:hypothetical protein